MANQPSKSKKGKEKGKHADLMCYNCDEKGHISRFCKKPKKPKSTDDSGKQEGNGKASGSGSRSANVAEKVEEEEGAWTAEEELDWFSEVVEAIGDEGRKGDMVKDLGDTSRKAFVVAETVKSNGTAELYDSGCTNHISLYHERFKNFEQTFSQSFKAANKQSFNTIGKGDLVIDIPNGNSSTKLRLIDVQYNKARAEDPMTFTRLCSLQHLFQVSDSLVFCSES